MRAEPVVSEAAAHDEVERTMTTPIATTSSATIDTAIRHHHAGRLAEAASIYRQILDADPQHHDALHLLGVVEIQRGNAQQAVDLISQALARNPEDYRALNHLGEAYRGLGFLDEAMTCFERALDLKDDFPQAYNNMGIVYQIRERLDLASGCFKKALTIDPKNAEAHANLASALLDQGLAEMAIASYKQALELRPEFPIALFNLGNAYKSLRRYDDAIDCYRKSISLKGDIADPYLGLARALHESGEREQAIEAFENACRIQPENVEARWGLVFTKLALVHDDPDAVGDYRETFARELDALDQWFDGARTANGFAAVGSMQPFYLAYHEESNRELLTRYGGICNRLSGHWQREQGLAPRNRSRASPVRVGLVSAHINNHSVWHALVKGWCKALNPERVELHVFALGNRQDAETDVARAAAKRFVQGGGNVQTLARTILDRELDVILYPEVGMDPMAAKLANLRLAPVQVTTWGHPETSGLPTIDYYLSAEDFEPADAQRNYTERLVLLPHLSCCYEALKVAHEDLALDRLGIDTSKPVLVCPGTPFKYAPHHDNLLVEIAQRLGQCQLLFFEYPMQGLFQRMIQRIGGAFASAGLNYRDFVVTIPWLTKPAFNSLLRQSDLYLDTIGFSGFNTAMQAIECDLPIVTREGRFLRGRLASGVLRRLGVPEMIAPSNEQYVNLAVRLVENRSQRDDVRARIAASRHVLFNDATPVRALEEFLMNPGRS